MDKPLTPETENTILDEALHTYPIVNIPRDITADVMARIQTVPAPRPFRLSWNDFILGSVLTICIAAVWFSLENLPPLIVAQVRKESILLYQHILVNTRWLTPALFLGLAGFFAALAIPSLRRELMK